MGVINNLMVGLRHLGACVRAVKKVLRQLNNNANVFASLV